MSPPSRMYDDGQPKKALGLVHCRVSGFQISIAPQLWSLGWLSTHIMYTFSFPWKKHIFSLAQIFFCMGQKHWKNPQENIKKNIRSWKHPLMLTQIFIVLCVKMINPYIKVTGCLSVFCVVVKIPLTAEHIWFSFTVKLFYRLGKVYQF